MTGVQTCALPISNKYNSIESKIMLIHKLEKILNIKHLNINTDAHLERFNEITSYTPEDHAIYSHVITDSKKAHNPKWKAVYDSLIVIYKNIYNNMFEKDDNGKPLTKKIRITQPDGTKKQVLFNNYKLDKKAIDAELTLYRYRDHDYEKLDKAVKKAFKLKPTSKRNPEGNFID